MTRHFLLLCTLTAVATGQSVRKDVLPGPDEVRWEQVPWQPSFADGVRTAMTEKKPLLLWAMNGHPLGCT